MDVIGKWINNWLNNGKTSSSSATRDVRSVKEIKEAGSSGKEALNDTANFSEEAQEINEINRLKKEMRAAEKAGDLKKAEKLTMQMKAVRNGGSIGGFNPLSEVAAELVMDALQYEMEEDSMKAINNARRQMKLSEINPSDNVHRHVLIELFSENPQAALWDFSQKLRDTNALRKEHGLPPVSMDTFQVMLAGGINKLGTNALKKEYVEPVLNMDYDNQVAKQTRNALTNNFSDEDVKYIRWDFLNHLREAAGKPQVSQKEYKVIEKHPEKGNLDFQKQYKEVQKKRKDSGASDITYDQYLRMLYNGKVNPLKDDPPIVPDDFDKRLFEIS